MKPQAYSILIVTVMLLILSCQSKEEAENSIQNTSTEVDISLEKMSPEKTGIHFNNRIKENERLHPFIWNFMYQGAGVGIGDINKDNLPDIFFCGNMVGDKLYLNKGNFEFEDITKSAGLENRLWSTGVTFVDINNDGWLDIYVCKNFFLLQESVRSNKLYINNGDLTFTESAEAYGIDDPGFSIQAYFFDAENDGDLDLYLVNQPMDQYAAQLARPESLRKLPFSDKLYINDNGKFIDKTLELGFQNQTYGLSAVIADLDNNGFQDIYLCNDYHHGDKLFMNYGGLNFKNEIESRINHSSFYSMGSDVDDFNNDGWLDFMILDMAFSDHIRSKTNMESMRPDRFNDLVEQGHHYQYAVNTLQENIGDARFRDIAHYANVSHTDWSWSPLFCDLNSDGNSELLISNGILRDLRNNDFIESMKSNQSFTVNQSNFQNIINSIPSTPVGNILFHNNGRKFEDISSSSGFSHKGFSSGMAYGDLDNDGDLDIVINNTNEKASLYRNVSIDDPQFVKVKLIGPDANIQAIGATVTLYSNGEQKLKSVQSARGYMSSSDTDLYFGLANLKSPEVDSLIVRWNHMYESKIVAPSIGSTLTIKYGDTSMRRERVDREKPNPILIEEKLLDHTHVENAFNDYESQVLLPHKLSQNGPGLNVVDLNNDRLEDIVIGSSIGHTSSIWLQAKNKTFMRSPFGWSSSLNKENINNLTIDLDNDGDIDIYSCNGGSQFKEGASENEDIILLNTEGEFKESDFSIEDTRIDGSALVHHDFNNDGLQDLIIGARSIPGRYGTIPSSKILINNGQGFSDKTEEYCSDWSKIGMVTAIEKKDIDNDGDLDFIVAGEWMPITLLINQGETFDKLEISNNENTLTGWWWTITATDFDNDGDIDIIAGNIGENNKFKASASKPLSLYAGDIDSNGDHDVLLTKRYKNKEVPVRGRECSTEEMPFISEKFKDYSSFAAASIQDIYDGQKLDQSTRLMVNTFSHFYFENIGDLKFKASRLNDDLQKACIKDIELIDINNDGLIDFFYGGNHFPVEPETVRYDSGGLGLCVNKGKGIWEVLDAEALGVYLNEDIRDLELINVAEEKYLLVTVNNGKLRSYKLLANK